ncbi:MAG: hypothetical protein HC809_01655, partial [Gammaproteobacteria bacterium]|nr:hypothetical protein [Gammaproteobacteria bacterium]
MNPAIEADVWAVLLLIGFCVPLAALGYEETLRQYRNRQRLQTQTHDLARQRALLAQFLPLD